MIAKAAELLPAQGPITAFVFLNTLQALEDLPFDEGLIKGATLFGVQPYLTEDRYRDKLRRGRIRSDDLSIVLQRDLATRSETRIDSLVSVFDLRLAMLQHPLQTGPVEELRWFVAETDALSKFRADAPQPFREKIIKETRRWVMRDLRDGGDDAHRVAGTYGTHDQHLHDDLIRHFGEKSIESWSEPTWEAFSLRLLWRVCRDGALSRRSARGRSSSGEIPIPKPIRHRDALLRASAEDSDALVNSILIRFCAAFVDQGFAGWTLPVREQGFYQGFANLHRNPTVAIDPWLSGLSRELDRLTKRNVSPLESIDESLQLLGVSFEERETFITATLLALRGWSGLLWQMETRPDRVAMGSPSGTLIEYLAIRLVLERLAIEYIAKNSIGYSGPLNELRDKIAIQNGTKCESSIEGQALRVFQLAQILGWSPPELHRLSVEAWCDLLSEINAFSEVDRRRLFHQAFERRFRRQALSALAIHTNKTPERVKSPRFQAAFCIDTREESFRRHLEEIAPDAETFSTAGFFNVPIYFRGVADAHFTTLCPIVVKPQHWITEEVVYSLVAENRRRAKTRRALGSASRTVHLGSRNIAGGALLTAGLGVLASVPLVARVLLPRLTAHVRKTIGSFVEAPQVTRLNLERTQDPPGPEGEHVGFRVNEMAGIGERVLRDIGLTSGFARLVFFFGHGSFCLNNPHKSAYDCGACSGGAGGPNARVLAAFLNDRRVRMLLAERGLNIPDDTVFIGGLHNTCSDKLTFFDLDQVPKSHRAEFEAALESLEETCQRNAHERCRRFQSAPLNLSIAEAHLHVEGRSEDLSQTRPEFGNATNAMCFVGRRSRLRGLYLDRRSFMQSYDPLQDDENLTILGRILAPVVPVCEGINLQYFFSYIDSPGWGCGTKLPHNVTSLLGVMDGAGSDLRPGLPWQGVEIHEPVRLLFVIETTPEGIQKIMNRDALVGKILKNGWAQLALLNPHSNEVQTYRAGQFYKFTPDFSELPKAMSSLDWYRGERDHLEFAQIVSTEQ